MLDTTQPAHERSEIFIRRPRVRDQEWHAWYETYLAQLVLLPGLSTAQRFRAVALGTPSWAYLALYSVASLDVFASDAYRRIGGGG